jgi:hypothetical protein
MSLADVQTVIERAVQEEEFRKELFANPDEALSGYDLSESEAAALKSIDSETLESVAGDVDERLSKAYFIGIYLGAAAASGKVPRWNRPGRMGYEEGW